MREILSHREFKARDCDYIAVVLSVLDGHIQLKLSALTQLLREFTFLFYKKVREKTSTRACSARSKRVSQVFLNENGRRKKTKGKKKCQKA